jgi:cation-transporting ATPase 13A2
VIALA